MFRKMLEEDRRRAGWSMGQASWHLGITVREYRDLAADVRLDGDEMTAHPDDGDAGHVSGTYMARVLPRASSPYESVVPFRLVLRSRRRHMVEFQPFGPKLPHDPEGILEHERDVREEAERAHDVKRASEAKKPWWAFWRRNRRPSA